MAFAQWFAKQPPAVCNGCGGPCAVSDIACAKCWHRAITNAAQIAAPVPAAPEPPLVAVEAEIIAWRAWKLDADAWGKPLLKSVTYDKVLWDGPTMTADKLPERGNSHGIHARRSLAALEDYADAAVVGTVALSGIVAEGSNGYRAEVATIRSLWVDPAHIGSRFCPLEFVSHVMERYAVEVELRTWEKVTPYRSALGGAAFGGIYKNIWGSSLAGSLNP